MEQNHFKQVIRLPTVILKTGLRRSSIYKKMSEGAFPKPIQLGTRSVGWLIEEVDAWIEQRITLTRSNALKCNNL